MSKVQVAEDIWYAVLDENGVPIYHTTNPKEADRVSEGTKGGDVIIMSNKESRDER